ncbi:MAG: hypothetical protein AAF587_02535 [Bacteroidota bacterium]
MQDPPTISSKDKLPVSQDFAALKAMGMELLPKLAGELWTDYNEHDPGITILEQLCYALTEMAYRASLPMKNLLTQEDGSLPLEKNALFPPPEIFPSNPLTIKDYQLFLVDRVPSIRQAWFTPILDPSLPNGWYQVWIEPKYFPPDPAIREEVNHVLYGMRNLGESFLPPIILQPEWFHPVAKGGQYGIYLQSHADPNQVFAQIWFDISQQISPSPPFQSLNDLLEAGYSTDQIYEGPLFQQGFLTPDYSPPAKVDHLSIAYIQNILFAISEIEQVKGLSIHPYPSSHIKAGKYGKINPLIALTFTVPPTIVKELEARNLQDELPKNLDSLQGNSYEGETAILNALGLDKAPDLPFWKLLLNASFQSPIQFFQGGKAVSPTYFQIKKALKQLNIEASEQMKQQLQNNSWDPHLPSGNYLDVASYYSLQHQFPALYGLAKDDIAPDASSYRRAQVRQLKGYLLVFEQFLANYLAQLSKLGTFFSTEAEARTYFYQALYQVPEVANLLKGFYSPELEEIDPLDFHRIWKAYQANDSNPYFSGLGQLVRDQEPYLDRKSRIMSHLLARFAEQLSSFIPFEPLSPAISAAWIKDFPQASRQRGNAHTAERTFLDLLSLSFSDWVVGRRASAKLMIQRGIVSGLHYFFNIRFERYNWDGFQASELFRDHQGTLLGANPDIETDLLTYGVQPTSYDIKKIQQGWQIFLKAPQSDGRLTYYLLPPIYLLLGPKKMPQNVPLDQGVHIDDSDAKAYRDFVVDLIRQMPKPSSLLSKNKLPPSYPGILQGMLIFEHAHLLPQTGWYIRDQTQTDLESGLAFSPELLAKVALLRQHSPHLLFTTGVITHDGTDIPASFFSSQLTMVIPASSPMDQATFQAFVRQELLKRVPAHLLPHILFLEPTIVDELITWTREKKEEEILKWLFAHLRHASN